MKQSAVTNYKKALPLHKMRIYFECKVSTFGRNWRQCLDFSFSFIMSPILLIRDIDFFIVVSDRKCSDK